MPLFIAPPFLDTKRKAKWAIRHTGTAWFSFLCCAQCRSDITEMMPCISVEVIDLVNACVDWRSSSSFWFSKSCIDLQILSRMWAATVEIPWTFKSVKNHITLTRILYSTGSSETSGLKARACVTIPFSVLVNRVFSLPKFFFYYYS